jgi:hypothetical protein
MYSIYNECPIGSRAHANALNFAPKITGISTDHAEDQKKLARLMKEWKCRCDQELRGLKLIRSATSEELMQILCEENEKKIADAGGLSNWEALTNKEKDILDAATVQKVCLRFGKQAFDNLTDEEKHSATFFCLGWMLHA